MAELVSWEWAERTAVLLAGREPLERSYHSDSLSSDFERATAEAEALVSADTGLCSSQGPARARVVDRAGWVHANLASFRRLLAPVGERVAARLGPAVMMGPSRVVAGMQLGVVLGWMATRVLGQYDLLLVEGEDTDDQDVVYYVGPNVLALEHRYGLPPEQLRLWIALHEVTHRAQFTGVPWLRDHFRSLVDQTLAGIDPDPRQLLVALGRLADAIRAGRNPLGEHGLLSLVASEEQLTLVDRVQGLMSLLEGHGNVTMDRAGSGRVPEADRFSALLRERRSAASGAAKVLEMLLGMDAKMRQYQEGERFVAEVERVGGPELLRRVWQGPEWLPGRREIVEPARWIERCAAPGGGA